ncbi:MAG: hypothetical protein HY537_15535 [Deltaproteobacteria bacterium]|nr:hypothetical protein [Deltaproteobacteria bacterium]
MWWSRLLQLGNRFQVVPTYLDNQKLPKAALSQRVEEFLRKESELQGWAAGYTFRQCKETQDRGPNQKEYFFEVLGNYLDMDSAGSEKEELSPTKGPDSSVAAREAEFQTRP